MVYLLQQVINLGLKISWWEPIDPSTIDESILSCVFPYWPLVTFFHALSALIPNWRIRPSLWYSGPVWPSLAPWKQISWFCLRRLFSRKVAKFYHTLKHAWMSTEGSGTLGFTHTPNPTHVNGESCHVIRLYSNSMSTRRKVRHTQDWSSGGASAHALTSHHHGPSRMVAASLENQPLSCLACWMLTKVDGKMSHCISAHPSVFTPL